MQLRQLHLQLTFAGAGVAGKDVEDELRPIQYPDVELALQVALLRRREFVIENDHVGRS